MNSEYNTEGYDHDISISIDYDEIRSTRYCERCRHETCCCPKYVPTLTGSIIWMVGDLGMMVISIIGDTPQKHLGQCYSAIDPDNRMEYVYQLMEYVAGPSHECVFRVKRVGDRNSLSSDTYSRRRRTPRLKHLRTINDHV